MTVEPGDVCWLGKDHPDFRAEYRMTSMTDCPCGLPAPYEACCGRFHQGADAPTAELLMRSRYTAFVRNDEKYLTRTWHPSTRPGDLTLDEHTKWTGLEVLETTEGTPFHTTGTVHFRAHYIDRGKRGHLDETSRFVRHEGAWVYVGPLKDR